MMADLSEALQVSTISMEKLSLNDGKLYNISEINALIENGAVQKIDFKTVRDYVPTYLKEKNVDFNKAVSLLGDPDTFNAYVKECGSMQPSVVKGILEYNFLPDNQFQFHPLTADPKTTGRSFEIFNEIRYRLSGADVHPQVSEKLEKGTQSDLGDAYKTLSARRPDLIVGNEYHELKVGKVNGKEGLVNFKSQIAATAEQMKKDPGVVSCYDIAKSANGFSILDDPRKIDSILDLAKQYPDRVSVTYCDYKVVVKDLKNYGTKLAEERMDKTFEKLKSYVAFDLEHTAHGDLIQIGAAKIDNGEITDTFKTLVHPDEAINWKIREITGISNEMVANAPSQTEALGKFKEFVGNNIMLGYNIKNSDMNVLNKLAEKTGVSFGNDISDVYQLVKQLPDDVNIKGQNGLSKVCERLQIPCENAHDALADTKMTYRLYEAIKDKMD